MVKEFAGLSATGVDFKATEFCWRISIDVGGSWLRSAHFIQVTPVPESDTGKVIQFSLGF